jgi:hypothetical protein
VYAQLDLEVMWKRSKNKGRLPNFHEFWNEEVYYKNDLKKTLMFEHYNFVDSIEQGTIIF